jgi:hypothetical protein
MKFNPHVDETFTEAWECYHGLMTDLPAAGMDDWEFNQGFYCGLSQEAKDHINTLARGTFFMINVEEARALFDKLSASERESEEHGLKENSRTVEIEPLTRKFQGMTLTQPVASETYQAEQEILAQPFNGKKLPMSKISGDAILDKLQNRLSGPALTTVPSILGPFKVPHALCDWGASMNIFLRMVYAFLDEDSLVPTPHQLRLADSTIMQPYGITKDVLIRFQDSLSLVDFMVMDMDPQQQTTIILGKPFLKSVKVTYRRVAKGSLLLHPTSSQSNIKFPESFSKFLACLG